MARAMTFEKLIFCVSYKYLKRKYLSIQQLIYLAKLRKITLAAKTSKRICGVTCISIGHKLCFYERLINIKNS